MANKISGLRVVVLLAALGCVPAFCQGEAERAAGYAVAPTPQTPRLIRFSGSVRGHEGTAAVTITFAIYTAQEGGEPLWFETQQVSLTKSGRYNVLLGSSSDAGIPVDIFSVEEPRWLGVRVDPSPEQARVLLVSVPYALKAVEAERLGGKTAEQFVTRSQLETEMRSRGVAIAPEAASGVTPSVISSGATSFVDNNSTEVVRIEQQGTGYALNVLGRLKLSGGNSAIEFGDGTTLGSAGSSVPAGAMVLCPFGGFAGYTTRVDLGAVLWPPRLPEPAIGYYSGDGQGERAYGAAGIYSRPDGSDDVFVTLGVGLGPSYLASTRVAHWTAGQSSLDFVPWAVATTTGVAPVPRRDVAYAQIGSKLYVSGGYNGTSYLATHQVFDMATRSWSNAAPLPVAMRLAAAAAVNGKVYVFGGSVPCPPGSPGTCTDAGLATVYEYDPVADAWTAKAPMSFARHGASAVELNGKVHLLGGAAHSYLASHEIYDPVSDTWSTAAAMPIPRWVATAVNVDGLLYITGGENGIASPNPGSAAAQAYGWSARNDSWVLVPMAIQRHGMASVAGHSAFLAIGGYVNQKIKDTVEAFRPGPLRYYCEKN